MPTDDSFARPHDTLFRYAFQRPEVAEGELRAVLPSAVVDAMDFRTLTLEPCSLVDPEQTEIESDLLFRVELAGEDAFVFILFEHQSSADPMMPFRMLRYMLRVWERWARALETPPRRLPVIVPLLLSNDERPWTAPLSLRALYDAPAAVLSALGPHLLDVTLRIDDLPAQTSAALKARATLNHFGRLVLFVMQRTRIAPDFVSELAAWLDVAAQVTATEQGMEDFALIVRYIHHTADFAPGSLRGLVRKLGKIVEETTMTAAERLRAEGKAEGEAKGKAEGEARGEAKGQAKLLLKLLTLRFGEPPPEARARIENASAADLDLFAERVLSECSLADLLA